MMNSLKSRHDHRDTKKTSGKLSDALAVRGLLIGIFFLLAARVYATSDPLDSSRVVQLLGLRLHHGFVLIHSRELVPVRHSNPTGVELDFAWHKTSEKAWESCHCYPKTGFVLTFWDYDQPDILGYGASGMFYLEPVFAAWHPAGFSVRAGIGLAYQTKPYDALSNPLNQSYSTYWAFVLQLGGSAHIRLHPRWLLDVTAVYNHTSNGGFQEPNKGINWTTASLGLGYYLTAPTFRNRIRKNWREEKSSETRFDLTVYLAFEEPVSKTYLLSPGIEAKASRQVSRLSALTLGAEWIYANGIRYEIEQNGRTESPQQLGLALGHEFLLGQFVFSQQFGVYAYRPFRVRDDLYQRYSLMYRYSRHLSFGGGLRAHRHVADFFDLRIAVSL